MGDEGARFLAGVVILLVIMFLVGTAEGIEYAGL